MYMCIYIYIYIYTYICRTGLTTCHGALRRPTRRAARPRTSAELGAKDRTADPTEVGIHWKIAAGNSREKSSGEVAILWRSATEIHNEI